MARVRKSATIKRVDCLWAVLLAGRVAKGEVVSKLKKSRVMMSKEPTGSDGVRTEKNPGCQLRSAGGVPLCAL